MTFYLFLRRWDQLFSNMQCMGTTWGDINDGWERGDVKTEKHTFCTSAFTLMMVFIHFQLIRSSYQSSRPYGETTWSCGSAYTGMITHAKLNHRYMRLPQKVYRSELISLQPLLSVRVWDNSRRMGKHRSSAVQKPIYAKLDAIFHNPAQTSEMVVHRITN